MIHCRASGWVYRNPKPHLRAIHAWHPSLALLEDGRMLCAFDLGQAVEGLDYRTYLSCSDDGGRTWTEPRPLLEDPTPRLATHTMRIARMRCGELVGFGGRFYRDDPEEGLTNRDTAGFVPMDLILSRSRDGGATWDRPTTIRPPLIGPAFEICHAILELDDGRWLAPTQTWRGWNGEAPNGMKAIALVSHDRGASWTQYIDTLAGSDPEVLHFEQSVAPLPDGRLLATAWAYHEPTGATRPTPYAVSHDGQSFGPLRQAPVRGQTAKLLALPDGRVLCAYRRDDQPGLWANLFRLDEHDRWITLAEAPLWQGPGINRVLDTNTSERLGSIKLGFPQLQLLPDGDVFIVFWCYEDGVYNIRWIRLALA